MSGRHIVPEANDLLLLIVHKPPLAARIGGTVLVAGAFFEHFEDPTETPACPAGEVAVSTLVAFGLRPGECEKIELRTNGEGLPQMFCTNRKSGGRVRTQPRWLEEIPLTAADGTRVELNITDRWETMAWPKTRDGSRRVLTSHYIGLYLEKVPYWNHLRLEYAEAEEKVRPYSFRNSWNTRAKALGIPDALVSRAHGNSEEVNKRSYKQATDQKARDAFRDALGR